MRLRAIALYCLLVYAIAWTIQILAIHRFGDLERPEAGVWLAGGMLAPAVVAGVFLVFHTPSRRGLKWRPNWRTLYLLPTAVAVPTVIALATVAGAHLFGWGASGWFDFSAGGVVVSGGPWVLGGGFQGWGAFALNVAATGAVFAAINGLVAVGEEFGWRGFLQTPLVERFGMTRGVVLLGLIWSFWHLPALLAGYNFPDYPALGAFVLFPIQLVAMSFFLAWVTIRSGSFLPAAIAHGAGNSIQEGVIANIDLVGPRLAQDLSTLALEVLVGLACWWALSRTRRLSASETRGRAGLAGGSH